MKGVDTVHKKLREITLNCTTAASHQTMVVAQAEILSNETAILPSKLLQGSWDLRLLVQTGSWTQRHVMFVCTSESS